MADPNPVQLALVQNRLDEIARQMGWVMVRTARSTVFSLSHDFSCFLSDAGGVLISQADGCPIHTGCGGIALKAVLKAFADDIQPEDVFLLNDVYTAGGNHLADWVVARPVFHEGERVGFSCNRAHQSDIGGGAAGTFNPQATEIWHEGIRLPPLKIVEAGVTREDMWQLLLLNCRTPELLDGDLRAMLGSTRIGMERLESLITDLGASTARACFDGVLDHGDRMFRACVEKLPDGVYHGEDWTENDCFEPIRTPVRVALTIKGDQVSVDFDGTGPQMRGFKNSSFANTQSAVYMGLKSFFDEALPHNEGVYRSIKINMPLGTAINPRPPAPTSNGTIVIAQHILHAVWQALSAADPQLACAGWGRSVHPTMSGHDGDTDRTYIVYHFQAMPGGGAVKGRDGFCQVGHLSALGGLYIPNIEPYEQLYPIRFVRQELRCDGGGAGEFRGGPGVDYEVAMRDPSVMHFRSEGIGPPSGYGIAGGQAGEGGYMEVWQVDGSHDVPEPFSTRHYESCVFHALSPGGGGWGEPMNRPIDNVLEDVVGGLVSCDAARTVYGVEIAVDGCSVDREATAALRATRVSDAPR
jgi:N-methylhydantoinase B